MSPRRNRRQAGDAEPVEEDRARRGVETVESGPDGEWMVRHAPGSTAAKTYRCPGCDQLIASGTPHLVVWPAAGGDVADRRHWHPACWRARSRRGPRILRSRDAPRYG